MNSHHHRALLNSEYHLTTLDDYSFCFPPLCLDHSDCNYFKCWSKVHHVPPRCYEFPLATRITLVWIIAVIAFILSAFKYFHIKNIVFSRWYRRNLQLSKCRLGCSRTSDWDQDPAVFDETNLWVIWTSIASCDLSQIFRLFEPKAFYYLHLNLILLRFYSSQSWFISTIHYFDDFQQVTIRSKYHCHILNCSN